MNNLYQSEKRGLAGLHLLFAFLPSLGVTYFVLRGGWGLGFFLAILAVELVFLAWLMLPFPGGRPIFGPGLPLFKKNAPLLGVMAAATLDLAFCYMLYDNIWLKLMNFPVIMVLCLLQYLMAAQIFEQDWDKPGFWEEAIISGIVRPFTGLGGFGLAISRLFGRPHARAADNPAESADPAAPPPRAEIPPAAHHPLVKVLLGFALAVPVLLLSGTILAAADPVFAKVLDKLAIPFENVSLKEILTNLFIAMLLVPFVFSFLYSGRSGKRVSPATSSAVQGAGGPGRTIRIDKTVLITFLSCVNLLYVIFAFVQLAYLTGAFKAVLPAGMTYADYARSGFFELAAVSAINLVLVLLAVKSADRGGPAGLVLRVESALLILCSSVQLASAMFRMKMYVDEYGLTLLRFFVTAFMLLLAALFILLTLKEFRPRFPLFKTFAAVILASLLILNHVNSDAWIARHNMRHYQSGHRIDLDYFRMLSVSSIPALIDLARSDDPLVSSDAVKMLRQINDELQTEDSRKWQNFNISREAARTMITEAIK
jgi:hypothetical protein